MHLTALPIEPWPRQCATLAVSVSTITKPSSHRASMGTGTARRAESSITIELVYQPVYSRRNQVRSATGPTAPPNERTRMLV